MFIFNDKKTLSELYDENNIFIKTNYRYLILKPWFFI